MDQMEYPAIAKDSACASIILTERHVVNVKKGSTTSQPVRIVIAIHPELLHDSLVVAQYLLVSFVSAKNVWLAESVISVNHCTGT